MIVKKMPISQGFSDINPVKILSKSVGFTCGNCPVFYDIETTGLSRSSSFLYLIGAVIQENNNWQLYQWMAENKEEERDILCEFFDFLRPASATIQYNGNSFDQPFLEERYKIHNLPSPFADLPALDLYRELKPCKDLLKLERMKQPDLEAFLGFSAREHCDGGECIRLYKTWTKKKVPVLAETVLGHNEEDLMGLGRIFSMLGYRSLFNGGFKPLTAAVEDKRLLMRFRLPQNVPAPVSQKGSGFYFTCEGNEGALLAELTDGKIRHYYSNYKDYDYIPGEDTAMPKQLSRYMDRSQKKPARPETCYIWFPCSKDFLTDTEKQRQYLNSTLPCLLKLNP